jgi:hypothetical protein
MLVRNPAMFAHWTLGPAVGWRAFVIAAPGHGRTRPLDRVMQPPAPVRWPLGDKRLALVAKPKEHGETNVPEFELSQRQPFCVKRAGCDTGGNIEVGKYARVVARSGP